MSKAPNPLNEKLERAGFIRCAIAGCSVYLEPVNWGSQWCQKHLNEQRQLAKARRKAKAK